LLAAALRQRQELDQQQASATDVATFLPLVATPSTKKSMATQ
jgi:hypothetical protein